MQKVIKSFGYYGGKMSHLKFILPLLPPSGTYIEPFAGSCSVFLNRTPESKVNLLNDRDSDIVNIFKQIREQPEELQRLLRYTPYSRDDFAMCSKERSDDPLEQARRALVRILCGFKHSTSCAPGDWSRKGFRHNPSSNIDNMINRIPALTDRLRLAQIENRPAIELIDRYKGIKDCLIYLDPPYVMSSRNGRAYQFEMKDTEHIELLESCWSANAMVAISGYHNEIYDEYLSDWNIREKDNRPRTSAREGKEIPMRKEVVWANYEFPTHPTPSALLIGS